jgi:hypothetical protein
MQRLFNEGTGDPVDLFWVANLWVARVVQAKIVQRFV